MIPVVIMGYLGRGQLNDHMLLNTRTYHISRVNLKSEVPYLDLLLKFVWS